VVKKVTSLLAFLISLQVKIVVGYLMLLSSKKCSTLTAVKQRDGAVLGIKSFTQHFVWFEFVIGSCFSPKGFDQLGFVVFFPP